MKMKEGNWNFENETNNHGMQEKEKYKKKHLDQDMEDENADGVIHSQHHQEKRAKREYYLKRNRQILERNNNESNLCEEESLGSNDDQVMDEVEALRKLEQCLIAKRTVIEQAITGDDSQQNGLLECHDLSKDNGQQQSTLDATKVQQIKSKQSSLRKDDQNVNLSFCGCGFLGIYHVGVASCFHQYAPQLSMHKISGSSAGALVAMAHICGNLQLAYCTTDILTIAIEARSHTLGSFHPSFDIQAQVRESLERGLPGDAYLKANGKLHVSLTRVEDGENVIINEFQSNEDLIQVLLCSCFIPFWSGLRLPKYKGVAYIDGGFSNNLLVLDGKTVTVSPFAGETDICPQDDTLNLLQINLSNTSFSLSPSNLYRLSHALLPPEPEILSDLCKQGFADGIRYLQRMNLISCTKCLEIRSSLLITTGGEDMKEVFSSAAKASNVHYQDCAPMCDSSSNGMSSLQQHIVLEQQEQETIEITENKSRRGSIVSITSNHKIHHSRQNQFKTNEGSTTMTPAVSLHNLLNCIDDSNECDDDVDFTDDCYECVLIRQRALCDPLPKQFSDRICEASEKVNKSLSKWLYSHRPVKYISYLMLPYYVPIDLTLAIIHRFWKKLPISREELNGFVNQVLDFITVLLRRMQSRSTSAMLMGFGSSWKEDVLAYEKELIRQKQQLARHHHHHSHHHNSPKISETSNISVSKQSTASLADCSLSSSSTYSQSHQSHNGHRELHSLEDTFDSIVDVTSKQEARIFAYHFRDAKNRLQVTEIFDLEKASSLNETC